MKLLIQLLTSGAILTACTSAPNPQTPLKISSLKPVDNTETIEVLTQGHTEFAFDLYQKLRTNPDKADKNIFISPLSISTAFGLAYAGARGDTAQEMTSVLHYTLPEDQLHPTMENLTKTVEDETEGQLFQMANALFVNRDTVLEPDYIALTKAFYKAEETRVNFKNQPQQAINTINDWVKVKTRGLIPETLKYTKDTNKTRNVMVNTAYLKAAWDVPFSEGLTKVGEFSTPDGKIQTPLMRMERQLRYSKGQNFSAIALPYQGGKMSFIAVLPDKEDGLPRLEKKLSPKYLQQILTRLSPLHNKTKYKVDLTLPKIIIADDYKLGSTLGDMGMKTAFSNSADFSGRIDPRKQPDSYSTKLGEVIHKTVLKLDEAGTEAAAVTAIDDIVVTSAPRKKPKVVEFKADHPFLTFILNNETGAILFMGRINNPVEE